jgi:SNF2 family DNA or RNA helicase
MEALHRQVLPFMLRRVKEDVLQVWPFVTTLTLGWRMNDAKVH